MKMYIVHVRHTSSRHTLNLFTHYIQCVSTVPWRNAPVDKKKYIYKIDKHMYGSAKGSDTGQKQNIIEGKTVFKPVSDTFTSNVRIWDVDLHHKTKNSELT